MLAAVAPILAQIAPGGFQGPPVNWVAFSPEVVLTATLVVVVLVDVFTERYDKGAINTLAGIGVLLSLLFVGVVVVTANNSESMFGGAYVVDNFALIMKALFLLSGYVVILISTNYIGEGDYWEGEYYQLILASVLGMLVMASARDLISIFIALELLSIPAYMLAAWRKRDLKSDEAGMKYYLMGVFATAVMLYGMSLLYGLTGDTLLTKINAAISTGTKPPAILILAVIFVLVGFGFKVSAVPFHTWAPDTYEGAPTPVTAFLAVASKAAGFVALMNLVFIGFLGRADIVQPLMWALSALTMTVGNLIALRQTNVVRMFAYSGVAQAGYMLAPLAVAGSSGTDPNVAVRSIVTYLLIYAAMNLGAFAVVIALARKTRSAEITSMSGAFHYAPGLAWCLTIFLTSLAGIPPFGGWFAKFSIFQALFTAATPAGYTLAVLLVVNSVIAAFYYMRVVRVMAFEPADDVDMTPVKVPSSLLVAMGITVVVTVLTGVVPAIVSQFASSASLVGFGG
ncbi:MAG: NADH-quinone oxidoreductase subunit N [Actinobacteria bacterium]|nr:NADH-quinone oxidoreductase subunit N [Actinomycetota bacterium]